MAVSTVQAALADVPAVFEAGGIVRARQVAVLSSRVLAPITLVRVRPGDRVRAGQPLIELDARQVDADRRRAAASRVAADNGMTAAAAETRGADAALALARATRDRVVTLYERRSATAQERDDAEAGVTGAEARAAGARARLAEATAALDASSAASEASTIAASYAVIAAPFAGVVSERHVDPGDMAAPGTPLLTIEDDSAWQVEVRLDETRAAGVAVGQAVGAIFDAATNGPAPETPVSGRVVEVGRVDPASHAYLVKVDLPGRPAVRSGAFGRVRFEGAPKRTLVVPAAAIVRRGQLVFVFTVAGDAVRLRMVSVGLPGPAGVEVASGLAAGDIVVVDPPESLLDGAKVTSRPRTGAAR